MEEERHRLLLQPRNHKPPNNRPLMFFHVLNKKTKSTSQKTKKKKKQSLLHLLQKNTNSSRSYSTHAHQHTCAIKSLHLVSHNAFPSNINNCSFTLNNTWKKAATGCYNRATTSHPPQLCHTLSNNNNIFIIINSPWTALRRTFVRPISRVRRARARHPPRS